MKEDKMKTVIKRDGKTQDFNPEKIKKVIIKHKQIYLYVQHFEYFCAQKPNN